MLIRQRSDDDGPELEAIARHTHRLDGYPRYLCTLAWPRARDSPRVIRPG